MDLQQERLETMRLLVCEHSLEIRSRREPEHLFTAALLGALGAVAWGAVALSEKASKFPFIHPALFAAFIAIAMGFTVGRKVHREHGIYVALRAEQLQIVKRMREASGLEDDELPAGIREQFKVTADGWLGSIKIIAFSTFSVTLFCLVIWLNALAK